LHYCCDFTLLVENQTAAYAGAAMGLEVKGTLPVAVKVILYRLETKGK
jgi:hypothetical protein